MYRFQPVASRKLILSLLHKERAGAGAIFNRTVSTYIAAGLPLSRVPQEQYHPRRHFLSTSGSSSLAAMPTEKHTSPPSSLAEETADVAGAAGKWNVGYFIGRFSPPHKGHIRVIKWLLTFCHKVVIGIGSCYEVGSPRHPILSFYRESMLARSLANENIPLHQIEFVYLQDFPETSPQKNGGDGWALWWEHVTGIPGFDRVTHMITGNEEQILSEIKQRNVSLDCNLINCELEMPAEFQFPYHASDLRSALVEGDYSRFEEVAATGTTQLLSLVGGLTGMKRILSKEGAVSFNPGRQSVDCFVTCRDRSVGSKIMVLLGNRSTEKANYPGKLACPGGGIDTYENPVNAALRELHEETGIRFIRKGSRDLVPGHIFHEGTCSILEMKFQGLYSDSDEEKAGSLGGSSLVFHIDLPDKSPEDFAAEISGESDLFNVRFVNIEEALVEKLAYQQTEMLESIHRQLSNLLPGIY